METLIFIYNAETGMSNMLVDVGRRIFTPDKYPCALCMVTYGALGKKKEWKEFIETLDYEVKFLHKDELPDFLAKENIDFPALIKTIAKNKYDILIDASEFDKIKDLETLKKVVSKKLQ